MMISLRRLKLTFDTFWIASSGTLNAVSTHPFITYGILIQLGVPWRRGYLLHGPPGSGKTSFIQALAGSLGYDIYIINLSLRGLADDKLALLMSQAPSQSIILIEDVDAAFNKRAQTTEDGYVTVGKEDSRLYLTAV